MEPASGTEPTKKVNFEELSKEDLIRKCYNLLAIAQKAKHSKNTLQEEVDILKNELSKTKVISSGTEEMLETLTQKNLNLTMAVDELRNHNKSLSRKLENCELELRENHEKLFLLDNENGSFKRQIQRLTDENEQLLGNLDVLEKQIVELSKLGVSQQNQLLQLEEHHITEKNGKLSSDGNQLTVLNEIDSLKTVKEELMLKIKNYENQLLHKDKSILQMEEQLLKKNTIIADLSSKLQELEKSVMDKFNENENIETQLNTENKLMKEKVKIYHSKIVKFAGIVKLLKEDKNNILNLSKLYTDQVNTWKSQLYTFREKCLNYIRNLETENEDLRLQLESFYKKENELVCSNKEEKRLLEEKFETDIKQYKKEQNNIIEKTNTQINNLEKLLEESCNKNLELKLQVDNMILDIEMYKKQIEELRKEKESFESLEVLKVQTQQLCLKNEDLNKEIENFINVESDLKNKLNEARTELDEDKVKMKVVQEEKENMIIDIEMYKKQIEELRKEKESFESLEELKVQTQQLCLKNEDLEKEIENFINVESDLKNKLNEAMTELDEDKVKLKVVQEEKENMMIDIEMYKKQIEELRKEKDSFESLEKLKVQTQQLCLKNEDLEKEIENFINVESDLNKKLKEAMKELDEDKLKLKVVEEEKKNSIKQINDSKAIIELYESELATLKSEHARLSETERNLLDEIMSLKKEKDNILGTIKDSNNKYNILLEEHQSKISTFETIENTLKHEIKSYEELGLKSSQAIEKLMQENHNLVIENDQLKQSLENINMQKNFSNVECQTDSTLATDLDQQLADLKRENTELLSDMNEMNQELKERGENISKLEAHCEEVLKKLQIYETQANKNIDNITEKEEVIGKLTKEIDSITSIKNEEIHQLKSEIETLKEKINSNMDSSYADAETMSTSTISRSDEVNRLKELEGSWEERYGKLRNLAVKLKGKIRELNNSLTLQQSENEELQKKLSVGIKTVQNLQSKCDTLEDDLDKSQKECKQYINRLNQIAHDISKDKQQLASKDEIIVDLKQKVEVLSNEKQLTENWKKQVGAKVQTLRKDLEAKELLRKELESKINELNTELQKKDELIKTESESHNQTKALLEQLNDQSKKNSMLNLEMKDYERSMKEITKKMDKQQEQVAALKSQIDSQKTVIEALKEERKLLEDKLLIAEQNLFAANTETGIYKSKVDQLDQTLKVKDEKIESLTKLLETARAEVEEISIELSRTITEHQKANEALRIERDHLRSQNAIVQQNFRDLQEELNIKLGELTNIQNEYEGYKIRAQSVLRQSQNRDVGFEEKLLEEINSLKTKNSSLNTELEDYKRVQEKLEKTVQEITSEKDIYFKQMKEFESELVEVKLQYTQLQAKHEKTILENAETVRNLKIHADTLSQCYRQQLSEQEKRYNQEIIDLKLRLDNALTSTESVTIPPTTPREEAEGSESTENSNAAGTNPIPLEKLLESDSNQNIDKIQKQLAEQESKVSHLTALLSETEKDLIKHVQMNNLLKEEIRRHQRSVEREKHAENLEYLKNVVVKFATLTSGDERSRLVPVLNTILKLSPEEAKQLNAVAKGESVLKGWTNYLPVWSPNKPQ